VTGLAHIFIDRQLDDKADAGFIKSARGHFVVPTLEVNASLSGPAESRALLQDERLKPWLSSGQLGTLASVFPPAWSKPVFIERALANTAALHRAGITVLAGTDSGNPGTAHGVSLHGELALLVRAGLTPMQALRAATADTAKTFKLADRGRIAKGLRADLLLVDGDPTTDITATRAIATIWKNGYAVDRSLNAEEKPQVAAAATSETVIADFETEAMAVRSGQPFSITTDMMAGGRSTATQAWSATGANGSKGALKVQGVVDGGLPYAWAGTLWMAGSAPMQPVDFSARRELVFKVRGPEERSGLAMIFSGPSAQARPAMLPFKITREWTEVRLPLADMAGADLSKLRALALTVGLPAGAFAFEVDDLELK